jgi:hypothetical protein
MLKPAPKYGILSVMLGKVCQKLRIQVLGRGYVHADINAKNNPYL